jgi:hypothetical protein
MADKMHHPKTGLEKAAAPQQKKHKPGELGARDPSGKFGGALRGQQEGFDEGGMGDAMDLETQNRLNR